MFQRLALATGILAVAAAPLTAQQAATAPQTNTPALEVGAVAPDFTLPAATRYGPLAQPVKLSDFKGKTVVLAFFPAARTRGCTVQMMAYRDRYGEVFHGGQDVVLIAISADPVAALHSWASDEDFPFLMGSDTDVAVADKYGAGRGTRTNRNLFVIGPDGRIAYRALPFREVDPTSYADLQGAIRKLLPADVN